MPADPTPSVWVSRWGIQGSGAAGDLDRAREEFDRQQCILWPGFMEAAFLAAVQRQIEEAQFHVMDHSGIGVEECMQANAALDLLHFVANDPKLFRVVQHVTGCGHIGCFAGRVYRMIPGRGHYDSWHSDVSEHRRIGMSVNLSAGIYEGGILHLRARGATDSFFSVANTGAGDAVLFRIDSHLQHRLTPVKGTVPKVAFAGWFCSEPEFLSLLTPPFQNGPRQASP